MDIDIAFHIPLWVLYIGFGVVVGVVLTVVAIFLAISEPDRRR